MKILFIGCRYIGDAVLSLSILAHLLEKHPSAKVVVATPLAPLDLYRPIPQVTQVIPMARKRYGQHWVDLWRKCAKTRWDIIVDLRGSAIAFTLSAKKRIVWKTPPTHEHRLVQMARLLKEEPPLIPCLWTTAADEEKAHAFLPQGAIVFAPVANWEGKQWPLSHFAELYYKLTQPKGLLPMARVVILASENERKACLPLFDQLPYERRYDLCGKLTLPQIYAGLKRAALFVGNDSGLMHVAATAGIPTIGLFGPSRDENFAPWGRMTRVVRTPESYEELIARIHSPHFQGGSVMGSITVDRVLKACEECLTTTVPSTLDKKGSKVCAALRAL